MDGYFWEIKFKHEVDNGEYPYNKSEEPNFFTTIEECMAFVLAQDHLDITQVEFIRRSLGVWKSQILLNDPNRKTKNND